jgi:peptidoglycan/xylan/chitin deacetylase (PgdA/CDA1 family)
MLNGIVRGVRNRLGPAGRQRFRAYTDPILAPIGSIKGASRASDGVALTFDDGPDPEVTPRLLDLLRERGVQSTFFILTDKAAAQRALVDRMVAEGHEIGLHCDRHDRLTALPTPEVRRRVAAARDRLAELIGGPVTLFRPPFGSQSLATYFVARSLGLDVVVWGPYAEDWLERPAADAARKALDGSRGGDILLLHDGLEVPDGEIPPTFDRVEMVRLILDGLAARGLRAVTVGALIADAGARRTAWFRG